ncbi:MAG: ABC transporter substrate-binding protein [Deltaproteobacteria bacterium]|nr:ABC transporter substrate-binding protein [Deltaproteobacteria bacterium]
MLCVNLPIHSNGSDTIPRSGGTIIVGRGADSLSLDPANSSDNESSKVIAHIFEGLVRYKNDSTEIEPALATSWETSPNGKEWIFHIRKKVMFHDGTPCNADAVVFSFLRQIDPAHAFYRKHFKYAGFTFKYVTKVEALDDHTVKITLEKPYAPFLSNLGMHHGAPIISPTALKKWGDDFAKHPVGTGPFKFGEWIPDERIVLERNTAYWNRSPLLEKLVYQTIKDASLRFDMFQRAQIHIADSISPADLSKINQLPGSSLIQVPGMNIVYLAMNMEKTPFNMLPVRKAVNHAINKENLINLFYQGMAVPTNNLIPPNMWGYNDQIAEYEYNPDKAKSLLKEAGYEKGFETTLWTMNVSRPYISLPLEIARAIKGNLSAVGINARIVSYDWGEYLSRTANGEHDLCLIGWISDNGDPDNFLYVLLDKENAVKPKSANRAFFVHELFHDLVIKAQQTLDKNERSRLYHQAQEIVHEQAPWVPLAHVQQTIAIQKRIHGVIMRPTGSLRFDQAWIGD